MDEKKQLIKDKFKAKMDGLKLSKKITIDQARAIVWMLESNHASLMGCLYVRQKKVDAKKIAEQIEIVKLNWPGPRNYGFSDCKKALISLDLDSETFALSIKKMGEECDWRARERQRGRIPPPWKNPASWYRSKRWEAEYCSQEPVQVNPGLAAAEATQRMLQEKEVPKEQRLTSIKDRLLKTRNQLSE